MEGATVCTGAFTLINCRIVANKLAIHGSNVASETVDNHVFS